MFQHRRGSSVCVVCPLPSAGKHGDICERKSQKNRLSPEVLFKPVAEFAVQVPIKVQHPVLLIVPHKIRIWLNVTFWLTLTINGISQCPLATNPPPLHTHPPTHPRSPGRLLWNIPVLQWINPNDFDASLSLGPASPWGSHLWFPVKYLDKFLGVSCKVTLQYRYSCPAHDELIF